MPKATWGAGDNALSAEDIDGAERQELVKRYSGPLPGAGTYRFVIKSLKKDKSGAGNDKVVVFATLDGSWQPNHKRYDGCPVWDHLPIMGSTKERVANFLDSIGATGADLLSKTVTDEAGYITKLGSVGDPNGLLVYITVKQKAVTKEYPNPSLETGFNAYIPVEDGDGDDADSDDTDDGDAPF